MDKTTPTQSIHTDTEIEVAKAATTHRRRIMKVLTKKSFCTLATASPAGNPHVAGVVYDFVDGDLWIHSMVTSRKARSIAANHRAAVTVPFRRLPAGPPFTIHFQADARIVAMDDPEATRLLAAGKLGGIAGHGALDEPDGCFLKITPTGTIHSYGPGASIIGLIRDPLHHGPGSFHIDQPDATQGATKNEVAA